MTTNFKIGGELEVNRLGFGAMRITGDGIWGPPEDHDECVRVLRRALELGVNFIDTADSYGPDVSERLIAEALAPYPDDLVIATKGGLTRHGPGDWRQKGDPDHLRSCLEGSLEKLQVDTIDLWQLHRIDSKVDRDEQFAVLKEFVDGGKVRFVGLSEVSVDEIKAAQEVVPVATVQNLYNLSNRSAEDVLEYCESQGIGFIPWFPLAVGKLASPGGVLDEAARRHEVPAGALALAWLLRRSPVMLPIPGTSKVAHLEENMKALGVELSDGEFEAIAAQAG